MDNGYYLIEIVPKNKNYALRIYLNDQKEPVEYYIDITKENGIDKDTKIPYFIDLYLDIIIQNNGEVNIIDEDELKDALKNSDITEDDYQLAQCVKENLLKEIDENNNDLINLDYMKYLKEM